MGFYARVVFPRLMNLFMAGSELKAQRRSLLAEVRGDVLEIGFGSGLNLSHYPAGVECLTAIDANPGMSSLARKRIDQSPIPVEHHVLNGERLPMADGAFDSVVSTWTLCSIADVGRALEEIRRVLKPGGRFYFIEHGLSPDSSIQRWQRRLNPIQKVIGDGCHLDRDFREIIAERRFAFLSLDTFYLKKGPRFVSYMYRGVATRA